MITLTPLFEALYPAQYYEKKAQGATSPDEKARYDMLSRRAREVRMKKTTKRVDSLKNKIAKPSNILRKPITPKPLPAPVAQSTPTVPGSLGNLQINR